MFENVETGYTAMVSRKMTLQQDMNIGFK